MVPSSRQPPRSDAATEAGERTLAELDDETVALLYDQVRAIAGRFRRTGFQADTLATTDLANETLLKVFSRMTDTSFVSEKHLVNTVAKVMYHLLCERLRRRKARQAQMQSTPLEHDPHDPVGESDHDWLLDFAEHVEALQQRRPRAAEVIRLRVFFSMTVQEIADTLACSKAAAQRELAFSRVFLRRLGYSANELGDTSSHPNKSPHRPDAD